MAKTTTTIKSSSNTDAIPAATLAYTGKAIIKIRRGNTVIQSKTIHNRGTKELFRLLAAALEGENISTQVPRYIDIEQSDEGTTYTSALVTRPYLTTPGLLYDELANAYAARFTTVIPYSSTRPYTGSAPRYGRMCLYSSSSSTNPLAIIDITPGTGNILGLTEGQNALIEWQVSISNASTATNS